MSIIEYEQYVEYIKKHYPKIHLQCINATDYFNKKVEVKEY